MSGIIWVGGYSVLDDGQAEGVGVLRRAHDGSLRYEGTAVAAPDPSYLLLDPLDPDLLLAVDEGAAGVQSFRRVDETRLESVGRVATGGTFPCHLGLRRVGGRRFLDVACYGDGVIAVHEIDETGRIGEVLQSLTSSGSGPLEAQDGPHAHATLAVGGLVLSTDLGTDAVHVHEVRDDGLLERVDTLALPAGTGPRDLLAHPAGVVWVLGEWGVDVTVLRREGVGFAVGETAPLRPQAQRDTGQVDQAAAMSPSPDGVHAIAGIRGSNRVAVLAADPDGGAPRPVGTFSAHVDGPRHHLLESGILHVSGQLSGTVSSLRLDAEPGGAALLGEPIAVPTPTFLLPDGAPRA